MAVNPAQRRRIFLLSLMLVGREDASFFVTPRRAIPEAPKSR
jgi:hypothetical protein